MGDAAADVEAICDALGLDRICTWGISGGGPHALACAALLPDRVAAAASVAGVAPYGAEGLDWLAGMGESNVEEFGLTLEGRDALAPWLEAEAEGLLAATADDIVEALETLLSPVDRAVLTGDFAATCAELDARRDRPSGATAGSTTTSRSPRAVGLRRRRDPGADTGLAGRRQDPLVPFAHGEWLAARIPGVEAHLMDGEGHLSLSERRLPEVHAWMLERLGG